MNDFGESRELFQLRSGRVILDEDMSDKMFIIKQNHPEKADDTTPASSGAKWVWQTSLLCSTTRKPVSPPDSVGCKKLFSAITRDRKATFRLGQMDMQASVCDMLRAMAKKTDGKTCCMLRLAADLVESMEVPVANT